MGGQPDNLSSFCFLSKTEKYRLDGLIGDVDALLRRMEEQVMEADGRTRAIAEEPNPEPKRNVMQSGDLHEKAWKEWTRRNFEQTSDLLVTQWESNAQLVDDLGELIAKQEQVKDFLAQVDAKTPSVGHRNTRRLAEVIQPDKRDILGLLYQKMREFSNAKLQPVYDGQLAKLNEISGQMNRLDDEKAAYWPDSGKLRTAGNIKGYKDITARTAALARELSMVEPVIVFTMQQLPSFDVMRSSSQKLVRGASAQRV